MPADDERSWKTLASSIKLRVAQLRDAAQRRYPAIKAALDKIAIQTVALEPRLSARLSLHCGGIHWWRLPHSTRLSAVLTSMKGRVCLGREDAIDLLKPAMEVGYHKLASA